MLQMMQKKVAADGELDKELHEKFMCYCKTGVANLEKSISDCETSMPEMVSKIEELEALLAQLKAEVALHQKDRQTAKDAITKATKIREEEHKAWVEGKEAREAQIAMIEKLMKAIAAMEKGAYGLVQEGKTFELLQQKAGAAAVSGVQKLLLSENLSISDFNRQQLSEFLSEGSSYTPQSGEIIGMLKQMKDTMEANLTEVSNEEESKVKIFKALVKAKLKEIDALTKLIEAKLKRIGEIQVEIVMLKEGLDDCGKSLIDDKKFLADLKKRLRDGAGGVRRPPEDARRGDGGPRGHHQGPERRRRPRSLEEDAAERKFAAGARAVRRGAPPCPGHPAGGDAGVEARPRQPHGA
jgi:chromosome segregation ATPase